MDIPHFVYRFASCAAILLRDGVQANRLYRFRTGRTDPIKHQVTRGGRGFPAGQSG
jgi:hypothetical protein